MGRSMGTTSRGGRALRVIRPDGEAKAQLDAVLRRLSPEQIRARDPVGFVHAYEDDADRELVGLVAASLAFGNVRAAKGKIADALRRIGPSPARAFDDPARIDGALSGWVHRLYTGEHLATLCAAARRVQKCHGSLGALFAACLETADRDGVVDPFREALAVWVGQIRHEMDGGPPERRRPTSTASRRGAAHLLPNPRSGSAMKRLLLFVRWMVRPADGIDLGLWPIAPSRLVCPVDVHIHTLATNLGWTKRRQANWATALDVTAALRRFDGADPLRYDVALCHMGMLQRCPSRRDAHRCEGCGVQPLCRHWRRSGRSPR